MAISNEHIISLQNNNEKLLKQNTQLHAQIFHLSGEIEKFKDLTHKKVSDVIRLYDGHNERVLDYLKTNNLLADHHLKNIQNLFPVKLGGAQ